MTGLAHLRLLMKHGLSFRKDRSYENILPTHAALVEHSKRATFQAAYIWSRALDSQIGQETPAEWGWVKKGDGWKVH